MFMKKLGESLESVPEFTTFPRTFEGYSWYKPLLLGIVTLIIYAILNGILFAALQFVLGSGNVASIMTAVQGGYDTLNTYTLPGYLTILTVVLLLPSLYLATRIVNYRPFLSYSTSRKSWNWGILFKSIGISAVVFFITTIIYILIKGFSFDNHFTIITFLACLILVPLQCVAEEYLLRGYVMQTMGSWIGIPLLAVFLQAIIFALGHPYNIIGVLSTFIVGSCLGLVTYYTKGIEMAAGIHIVNNLFSFCSSGLGIEKIVTNVDLLSFSMDIITVIISSILLLYLSGKQDWFKNTDG
ncbi:MAG: hypothetical protein BZ136_00540 [Methanosphaera sp. rholeuAM74]|nr:MAG: hypothetical protein BZ136_00540 [Methanosphaera sp. rholeuAM74]